MPSLLLALLLSALAACAGELAPRFRSNLDAMSRAYRPFHRGLKSRSPKAVAADLAAVQAAVDDAASLLKELAARREKAQAVEGSSADWLLVKAQLEEADDDRRELQAALKDFSRRLEGSKASLPRAELEAFKAALRRPYKDLYRKLEALRELFETLE